MRTRKHRYVKAKASAAQLAEIPKDKGSFGVSFSAIFLHEKKDGIPEGRSPLRSGLFFRSSTGLVPSKTAHYPLPTVH